MSFKIEEFRIPRLVRTDTITADPSIRPDLWANDIAIDTAAYVIWQGVGWPSQEATYEAIQEAQIKFGSNNPIRVVVNWPKPGDKFMGVDFV